MELSISGFVEKPKQFKFLWSKLSNQDRLERLELILKENDVPPYLIEKLAEDYNSIYLLGQQQKDIDFMQIIMQSNFAIPIVDDHKKVYKQSMMKNGDKLVTNENELNTLEFPYSQKVVDNENEYNDFISTFNHVVMRKSNLDETYVLTDNANIVGIYLDTCLNYHMNNVINKMNPPLDVCHKMNYIKHKMFTGESQINDIFQQDLEECDGIKNTFMYDKSWEDYGNDFKLMISDKENDINSDYYNNVFNEIKHKIATDNFNFSKKYLNTLIENVKTINNNMINYLFLMFSGNYLHNMKEVIKLIIANELNIKFNGTKKEINNKLKMMLDLEKNNKDPIKLYKQICNNGDKKHSLVCKKLDNKEIVNYRFNVIKDLIKKYNYYVKEIKQHKIINELILKLKEILKEKSQKHDVYSWYIKTALGDKVYHELIKKTKETGLYIHDLISKKQEKAITDFIVSLKKQQENITKLFKQDEPGIQLRIIYDTSNDEDAKYNALRKLIKFYVTNEPNDNLQYSLKDVDYDIVCEHEKILLQMHNTYNENKKQELKYTLESKFYSQSSDYDNNVFISCKYCGRPITRSALKVHDSYQKGTGYKNVGYGNAIINRIDSKIMKQIALVLDSLKLIIKDKISYSITPESVYSSISDFIKNYFGKDKLDMGDSINISPLIDKIIATFTIVKSIYEVVRSFGNIYPTGSRNIIEELFDKKDNENEILNYLYEWGFKKLKKLPYINIANKDKNLDIFKQIYKKIKKREITVASTVIKTPTSYKKNEKYDKMIENHDYKNVNLEDIRKYFMKKALTSYNKHIEIKPINKILI